MPKPIPFDTFGRVRILPMKVLEISGDSSLELADPFTNPVIDGKAAINYGAAAFRMEDTDFRNAFTAGLNKLKKEGKLIDLIGQFEGFDEGALPGDTTVYDICPDAY